MSTFCSICFQAEIAQESFWSCGLLTKFRNEQEMRWRNKLQKHRDDYIFPAMIMMQLIRWSIRMDWEIFGVQTTNIMWSDASQTISKGGLSDWLTMSLWDTLDPLSHLYISVHARWEQGLCLGDFLWFLCIWFVYIFLWYFWHTAQPKLFFPLITCSMKPNQYNSYTNQKYQSYKSYLDSGVKWTLEFALPQSQSMTRCELCMVHWAIHIS